ncbi:MAG: beta-ketoacyl synthase N-terminal-like domain-containing protein, partial [Candidatus Thiodiazotropha sp.]
MSEQAYIVAARRTPVGKAPRGVFRQTRPDDLLTHAIQGVLGDCPGLPTEQIEDVIIGCAMPEAEQGLNVARVSSLLAGLPDSVPGVTINRFCSSGLQSIAIAADRIRLGEADIIVAGGVESMSMVPMMGNKVAINPAVFEDDNVSIAYGMGVTAENVAERWKVSREDQDSFALQSHQRALAAINAGHFEREILPYLARQHLPDEGNTIRIIERPVKSDEGPRPDSSLEGLAKLRPVFAAK